MSNLRYKVIFADKDTLQLDTVSIVPGSVKAYDLNGQSIAQKCINENWSSGKIILSSNCHADSIKVYYRVLSFNLNAPIRHKDPDRLIGKGSTPNPFQYQPPPPTLSLFPDRGLLANGNISRGVTFGNNQDVFVNSSLNLQLNGKIGNGIDLLASITDENIPVQPEGNTQQLQEFDKVFIQFSKDKNKLIAGDFELRRPDSYFMNFFKRGQGAYASTSFLLNDTTSSKKHRTLNSAASLAIAKGRFSRSTFNGSEGNQGPYRLSGNDGEKFIIVLSGTEKVFIDGQLMKRGMQNDYVIDYNTAEITFMPKRLITKDSRIIVEFEYSDRNYVRSFYFLNNEFESEKFKIKLNIYSEQDSKNQPLLQDVDSARQSIMASVGDSINLAYFPTADSLTSFDETRVLYIKKDTITAVGNTYSIYIYSNDPNSARWQVNFSEVGAGKGDYVQDIRSANGRVFKWVAPINGISQGNYLPVQLLITPKLRRMITLGGDIRLDAKSNFSVETALSENDINLFSSMAKANDQGLGLRLHYDHKTSLSTDTINGWLVNSKVDYEFAGKNFKALEPYRSPEFSRDWNVIGLSTINDENILSTEVKMDKRDLGNVGYILKTYQRGNQYSGWNHGLHTDLHYRNFLFTGSGNYLRSNGSINKTEFLRHQLDLNKSISNSFSIGIKENSENNQFKYPGTDSLLKTSYSWQEYYGYSTYKDSTGNKANIIFKHRIDKGVKLNELYKAAEANELTATGELSGNPKNTLRITSSYRNLKVLDTLLISTPELQTLVNRIDHQINLVDGFINAVTFYEISSGRDRKQEFYYLEVPAGQGSYTYIGDLNGNNVQDLNEFAIANYTDQAKYIRVYFNSDQYFATRSNAFSEVLNINPSSLRRNNKTLPIWQRFSNQLILRLDKKTSGENILSALNPFSRNINDTILVSANSNLRNTLFYNRSDPGFGADYTWQVNKNKALLVNGFDSRQLADHQINMRCSISHSIQSNLLIEQENRTNSSDFFTERNYKIISQYVEPKIIIQPNTRFRMTGSYRYGNRNNKEGMKEQLLENRISLETRYNSTNSGTFSARFNFIQMKYNGATNSFIAYELLSGLQPGTNFTWNISLIKNLNNLMQLNLNYEGRKSEKSKMIHTGGVQFRAFF